MTKTRFEIELEFVQALCNPEYLQFLYQKNYFKNKQFTDFLEYLKYWKTEPYKNFLMYTQCLDILDLITNDAFVETLHDDNVIIALGEQQINLWNNKV